MEPDVSNRHSVVLRRGPIDCQVCVPASWSDAEVIAFTERVSPSGTSNGWKIRRTGDPGLGGDPERNPCADRNTFIHMILDA